MPTLESRILTAVKQLTPYASVSAVAEHVGIPVSTASVLLNLLEQQGKIRARRIGLNKFYFIARGGAK